MAAATAEEGAGPASGAAAKAEERPAPAELARPDPPATPAEGSPGPAGALEVAIDKTAFRVTLPDGHVLSDSEMIGVVLTVRDEDGAWRKVRVEKIEADPRDPEITLYDLSVQNPQTNAWAPMCAPGPDGLARAMPLAGTWTADGRHEAVEGAFNVTCTSGAIGKCVRFGYKPWASASDGGSLWEEHQACVRMVRADYCGDGTAFTRTGMLINVGDRRGIQRVDEAPEFVLEAGWGPAGAICVHHPRVAENVTLAQLEARCPDRLRGRTGAACTQAVVTADPQYRLFNLSVPAK
ncbi:ADYC domain-containing protein [Nannocystis pusilla]|uniref:ADYC domain-containing protein n=1 Tax=Nannocystis pusilla TaxID=889268 RepID=UPI003DA63270